ncbi:MAG: hypothetical protein ACTSO7_09890 [Candidatus Heimdallarchaeota archaeon]
MSDDLLQANERYQKRLSEGFFYILAFFAVNILAWVLMFSLTSAEDLSRFTTIVFAGPLVFVFSLAFLAVVYTLRRDSAKSKLKGCLDQELIYWKMEAIELAINDIETEAPIPLEKIELYSHNLLDEKLSAEYSSLNLYKLKIVFPETITILQNLLYEKPFLGTYHPVEQQFTKNFSKK